MSGSVYGDPNSDYVFNVPKKGGPTYEDYVKKYLPLPNVGYATGLEGLEEPGCSKVFRNRATGQVKKMMMPGLDTYYAMWRNAALIWPHKPALASRPYDYKTKTLEPRYVSESFAEVDAKRRNFGSGVLHLLRNNPFKKADCEAHRKIDAHVADAGLYDKDNLSFVLTLFSENRPEWVIADLACVGHSITNTVLYDTLGPTASEYILGLTESPVVVCSYEHVREILAVKKRLPEKLAPLIAVVSMDPLNNVSDAEAADLVSSARQIGIELYDFDQVLGVGKIFPLADIPPKPTTAYTISFTSGTTGSAPKGVVLTQENAALGICFITCMVPPIEDDLEFVFLPLAHIFERQAIAFTLTTGGMAGFPQKNGTPLTLVEDLKILKPKHMANVPRVYTKFEAAIKHATINLDLAAKRAIFSKIVDTKSERQSGADGAMGGHWLYDRVLLPKIRQLLGFDRMVYCITGLAPIATLTIKFMKAALNIGFSQGYGLTELFAGFSFSLQYEAEPGSCGPPGICSDIRVRELPELGYTLDDPRGASGDLEIRGPQMFSHYYKNPEETAKVLKNGWFATGDVARICPKTGRLYIVDRVKNFFKLAQGEYVTPEKVENAYLSSNPLLTQCFVHGDSVRSHLVAVIGVDPQRIVNFLAECGVGQAELALEADILRAVNKLEHRSALLRHLNGNVTGLNGYERIQNIYVEFEPLRVERDVITPTVKIRRPIAARFFREQIDEMYGEPALLAKAKF